MCMCNCCLCFCDLYIVFSRPEFVFRKLCQISAHSMGCNTLDYLFYDNVLDCTSGARRKSLILVSGGDDQSVTQSLLSFVAIGQVRTSLLPIFYYLSFDYSCWSRT